ncbi:MAG TPA: universal stress protein [Candidatus Binatia bacterium]|nr:universal stress protein [Candidatus Binatia bacterium]
MPAAKTYLVPVDFSKTSEAALRYALDEARDDSGKLFLLHVIPTSAYTIAAPEGGAPGMYVDYIKIAQESAEKEMQKLIKKYKLKPNEYRSKIVRGGDPPDVIAKQAKKARAKMIVMGSHGRSGIERFFLGSVAERTLRYAACPTLIVKR